MTAYVPLTVGYQYLIVELLLYALIAADLAVIVKHLRRIFWGG